MPCYVLMGANLAPEIAKENMSEATIGCDKQEIGIILKQLFQAPYFRISVSEDREAVEICGALKVATPNFLNVSTLKIIILRISLLARQDLLMD